MGEEAHNGGSHQQHHHHHHQPAEAGRVASPPGPRAGGLRARGPGDGERVAPGPSVSGLGGDRASSSDSSQSGGGAAADHAQRTPTELGQAPARARVSSGGGIAGVYQLEKAGRTNAARRAQQAASEPTLVSGGPGDPADGFDWGSATVGAGAVLALGALAGTVLLTVRRRTATAPSVSTG
jgi:hypothetical protein